MSASRARRLLVVSQVPPPYGGLSVHTQRLCAAAERRGFAVTVVPPPDVEFPPGPLRSLRVLAAQLGWLARVATRPADIVHDHISTYSIGSRGASLAIQVALLAVLRLRRTPWVLSCGKGLLPARLAECSPRLRALYRRLYAGVTAGIAKNEPILRAFAELGIGARSRVVGTFLEPVRPPSGAPQAPEVEAFFAAHPRVVATAGFRFGTLYHLHDVVRAVAALRTAAAPGAPSLGLVVLANRDADAAGRAAYDAAVRETGIGDHVLLLCDVDDALETIARTHVFVRATDADGDANTVKEAMWVGVPVLATDLPNRPPGIELIARDELDQLAPRLGALLDRPDAAAIARNREFVREDITRNADAIFGIYEEALR